MKATRKTGTWLWALLAAAILTALLTATAFGDFVEISGFFVFSEDLKMRR